MDLSVGVFQCVLPLIYCYSYVCIIRMCDQWCVLVMGSVVGKHRRAVNSELRQSVSTLLVNNCTTDTPIIDELNCSRVYFAFTAFIDSHLQRFYPFYAIYEQNNEILLQCKR